MTSYENDVPLSLSFQLHSKQECEIIEDGKKHILVLYNCQLDMTGEVSFQAANAKSAANLKVKGTLCLPAMLLYFLCKSSL